MPPEFELLPDRPIDADRKEDVKFGHVEISEVVFQTIHKAQPPFTIGLYGRWGVGKSTIAGLVEKRAEYEGYKTFLFDVWKYERDSLRRQFLIELDKKLGLGLNYKEVLNQSLTLEDPTRHPPVFDWRLLFNQFGLVFIVLTAIGLAGKFFLAGSTFGSEWSILSEAVTSVGLAGLLLQAAVNGVIRLQTSITKDKTDSAEGFEDRFYEILEKIKGQKLLVIMDNLDRIEDQKMVDVLSDIKTFLSKDGENHSVIFLIPCDNGALRAQLIRTHGNYFDADEFLRKFFNLTIEIPKFINLDLDDYVRDLLVQTKIEQFKNNPDLEGVLIYAFRDNPREIKQFINTLVAAFLLATRRSLEVVLSNTAFLAKILVLRQKFPLVYRILEEKSLRSSLSLSDNDLKAQIDQGLRDDFNQSDNERAYTITQFSAFNDLTNGINRPELSAFISLRQSDKEQQVPESEKFIIAAEEDDLSTAETILEEVVKTGKTKDLDDILRGRVIRNHNGIKYVNFLSNILSASSKNKIVLPGFFNESAKYFPSFQSFRNSLPDLGPDILFDHFYKSLWPSNKKKPLLTLLQILTQANDSSPIFEEGYMRRWIDTLVANLEEFRPYTHEIQTAIKDHLFRFPLISKFNTEDLQKKYLTSAAISKFIQSIQPEELAVEQEPRLVEFLGSLTLSTEQKKEALLKLESLLDGEMTLDSKNRTGIVDPIGRALEMLDLNSMGPGTPTTDQKAYIERLSTKLGNLYSSNGDWERKRSYLPTLSIARAVEFNDQKETLKSYLSDFAQSSPIEMLKGMPDSYIDETVTILPTQLARRGIQDPEFLIGRKLYEKLPKAEVEQHVVFPLIQANSPRIPKLLKLLKYDLADKSSAIDQITSRLDQIEEGSFEEWLGTLKPLGIESDAARIETFYQKLKTIKAQTPAREEMIKNYVKKNSTLFSAGQRAKLGDEPPPEETPTAL
jgi:hypothetical protein